MAKKKTAGVSKLKLSIKERLLIAPILPTENSILTSMIIRKFREQIEFSEKEVKDSEIKSSNNVITWNQAKAKDRYFDVSEKMMEIIKTAAESIAKLDKISQDYIAIFERFCPESFKKIMDSIL